MDKSYINELECLKDRMVVTEMYNKSNSITDLICALIGACIPEVDAAKQLINCQVNSFQEKKRKQFCEIIMSEPILITSDKVKDVNFIMEFARTIDVIDRLAQNDKVVYIAKLFHKSFIDTKDFDLDLYEEYLHRLDFLSLKEINLLIELYKYSKKHVQEFHEEWYTYKKIVAKELNISELEVVSIFSGLCMTGFCREVNVLFPSDGDLENPYCVTEYFERFVQMILGN